MDLKVHTTGGVVKPGETLMTVVPLGQTLVVEAMVKPEDVETIAPGQTARVSFPALRPVQPAATGRRRGNRLGRPTDGGT